MGGLGYRPGVTLGKSVHLSGGCSLLQQGAPACLPHSVLRGASGDKGKPGVDFHIRDEYQVSVRRQRLWL